MRVVTMKPGEPPKIEEIAGRLDELQAIVGGYIESVPIFDSAWADKITIYCNEEGRLLDLEYNTYIEGNAIVGPIVVVGRGRAGKSRSLTEKEANEVMKLIYGE